MSNLGFDGVILLAHYPGIPVLPRQFFFFETGLVRRSATHARLPLLDRQIVLGIVHRQSLPPFDTYRIDS